MEKLQLYDLVTLDKSNNEIIFHYLSKNVPKEKLVSSNFGSIKHLKGSRLIDRKDSYLDEQNQSKFIVKKRSPADKIYITEKIDGMNAGIYKKDNEFYALNRKGYDVRSNLIYEDGTLNLLFLFWAYRVNLFSKIQMFSKHSFDNKEIFFPEGYRFVFENCMMKHSLSYDFKNREPIFLLAIYDDNNKRLNFEETIKIVKQNRIYQLPPLLGAECAIPTETILRNYDSSLVGCKDKMEGFVYWYETYDNNNKKYKFEQLAKFVYNIKAGTSKEFPNSFNKWYNYKEYIELKSKICNYWMGE